MRLRLRVSVTINDNTVQVRQGRILIAATGYGDLRAAWHCPT